MLTRRILTLIAATLITLTAALTIAGTTSGTASAMKFYNCRTVPTSPMCS